MTQHNYCSKCGSPLAADNRFCPNCGVRIGGGENDRQREGGWQREATRQREGDWQREETRQREGDWQREETRQREATGADRSESGTTGMFPRMLAYIPGLFWVPLAADSRDRNNRESANQGLLLLLYCIIGAILFSIAGGILAYVSIRSAAASAYSQSAAPYQYSYQYPYQYPSTYPGTGFDEFGAYFNQFGAYFNRFGEIFRPSGSVAASNSVFGIFGLLISLIHLLYILYIPVNMIWGIIHCINHPEPHILPFIGKIKIIRQ